MNVLEKILEEIEEKFKTADAEKCDCEECGVSTRRCALETTAIGKWNRRVKE
jgi:hypothetical protein